MSTEWLPFYGIALGAVGSLVLALAALMVRRQDNEPRYQWAVFSGAICILLGFMLGALFYLGEKYGYGIALRQYITPPVVIVCLVFVGGRFITRRSRRNARREDATANLSSLRIRSNMELAVYYDKAYPSQWLRRHSADLSRQLTAQGFKRLDAEELEVWMRQKVDNKTAGQSSVVFSQDIVPDTIFPDAVDCANVLLRKYLDEGGRVVWLGDIPLWLRGFSRSSNNQTQEVWQFGVPTAMLGIVPLIADSSSKCIWVDNLKQVMKSSWYSMRPINIRNHTNFIGLQIIPLALVNVTLIPSSYNIIQISRWKKARTRVTQGSAQLGAMGYGVGGGLSVAETFPKELSIEKSMRLACAWQIRFNALYPTQGFYRMLDAQFTELNSTILDDIRTLATLNRAI